MLNQIHSKTSPPYPSFIIGGAAKSGTTSLARYLGQVPGIFIPNQEPNFFTYVHRPTHYQIQNHPFVYDEQSYLNMLTPPETKQDISLTGEKSVSYLYRGYYPHVINNVQNYHPDWQNIRWIFILRNPVERAYSQYIHNCNFHEKLPFDEAIYAWPEREEQGWIPAYDYLGASCYSEALGNYINQFNHVKVYFFEDLEQRPQWLIENILKFLEIDASHLNIDFKQHNASGIAKYPRISQAMRWLNKKAKQQFPGKTLFPAGLRLWLKNLIRHKPVMPDSIERELYPFFEPEVVRVEELTSRKLLDWRL